VDLGIEGRTALVTGASMGIGRAVALRLAREGVNVVICARREAPLLSLADEIAELGRTVVAVPCDVTDPNASAHVLDVASGRLPAPDILVNNAGRADPVKLLDTTDGDWIAGLELNLLSTVRFTRACLPAMVANRWGRVINVASTTAKLADPYHPIYGAAKAAMINFTKSVSIGFVQDGVRSNCVLPGLVRTELVESNIRSAAAHTGKSPEDLMERMLEKWPIPAGRLGEPEDVADAIAFLASNNADWITGVTFPIDGGTIPVAG
jgi:3-oxoacyl-[acyl-carrier protein] reductase